jgi:hypothetical protein
LAAGWLAKPARGTEKQSGFCPVDGGPGRTGTARQPELGGNEATWILLPKSARKTRRECPASHHTVEENE